MWTVIKFDNKKINLLQKDLREKIDNRFKIYIPKIGIINNKKKQNY